MSNTITATAQATVMTFAENKHFLTDEGGYVQDFYTKANTYITFNDSGLSISESESPFASQFGSSQLSFLQSGVPVAWLANNMLYVIRAELQKLTVGRTTDGYYDFEVDTDGVLFVRGR